MVSLDTNVCMGVLTGRSTRLIETLRRTSPEDIRVCSVVRAELLYGARKSSRVADNLRLLGDPQLPRVFPSS